MIWLNKNKFFNYYLPLILAAVILIVTFSAYFYFEKNKTADAAWYSSSWGFRKPITIDKNKISQTATSTFSSFPIEISVTDSDLKFTGFGGKVGVSSGYDILFSDSNGTTKLDHEIESYASSTGQLTAWVRIPTLTATADYTIYMYFGNAASSDQSNKTGVWDSNYKGVYHVPNGTTLSSADSTSNANNATQYGSSSAITGKIGGGVNFSAYGDDFGITDVSLSGVDYTISTWFNTPFPTTGSWNTLTRGSGADHQVIVQQSNWHLGVYNNACCFVDSGFDMSTLAGGWHHLTAAASGSNTLFYIDGVYVATSAFKSSSQISYWGNYQGGGQQWGKADELRLSTGVARSADWIKTEYNNQSSPSSFYSYGVLSVNTTGVTPNTGSWYNSAWNYRMPITIDHTKVASSTGVSLSQFPVLISVTNTNLKTVANSGGVATSTGDDIVFTDSDGSTKLPHEIESYASSTGALIAWVKVPTVSALQDHTIYIYYGNSSAYNQQNPTGVWDSGYKGVWHLANGTTFSPSDSTGINSPTNNNVTATTGQIDGAGSFNGTNGYIDTGLNPSNTLGQTVTVSAWIKPNSWSNYKGVAGAHNYTLSYHGIVFIQYDTGNIGCGYGDGSNWVPNITSSSSNFPTGSWTYVSCVFKGSNYTKLYINNNSVLQATDSTNIAHETTFWIGRAFNDTNRYFDGVIDELHVSNTERSADWIKTEYNNQNSPSTFETFGSQQTQDNAFTGGNWYSVGGTWTSRKAITIDHNKVSTASGTPLSNFPMLFSVTDTDLKYTGSGGRVTSSTGADILFTDSDGVTKLNYERETYTSTTGQLIAWVQIPTLSPAQDKTIYIYFGGPTSTDQQNITATWESNYKGVYHLSEDPGGSSPQFKDSTSNALNLTVAGSGGTMTSATGQIGTGINNTWANQYSGHYAASSGTPGTGTGDATVSGWIKLTGNLATTDGNFQFLFGRPNAGYPYSATYVFLRDNLKITGAVNQEGGVMSDSPTVLSLNTWYYVTLTRNGSSDVLYLNGNPELTYADPYGPPRDTSTFNISQSIYGSDTFYDEVRMSAGGRSADWVKTEYYNQVSPSSFYSYGALGSGAAGGGGSQLSSRSWYNKNWTYRMPITIDHTKVASSTSTTLVNFPVLISVTNTNLKTVANSGGVSSANGDDILFTDSDGSTKLPHEIETYASTTGQLIAWVKVPTVSALQDHTIYIYYGNGSAYNQQNATAVWDNNYKAVYHLSNGITLSPNDSTSNARTGTLLNSPSAVTGQVDGAMYSNTSGNKDMTSSDTGLPSGQSSRTIEAWVNPQSSFTANEIIGYGTASNSQLFGIRFINSTTFEFTGWSDDYDVTYSFSLNTFYHIVATYDGTNVKIYINGSLQGTSSSKTLNTVLNGTLYIGDTPWNVQNGNEFTGYIDEVRLSNINRSADWIKTEYNNQNSPSTFETFGSQQTQASAFTGGNWYSVGGTWTNRKLITIDHNKVSSVNGTLLNNFPMLFSVTDSDLKYVGNGGRVASTTGADILFTDSDGVTKLNYERESYSSTTGTTIAWVQIPTLSPAQDKTIYIYFGGPTSTDQQNKTGTWDSTYTGVWHLPNGTTLSANDSTANALNGTINGAGAVAGKINGAASFNASNYISLGSPSAVNFGANDYSFEVWIYPTSQVDSEILSKDGVSGRQWQLALGSTGYIRSTIFDGSGFTIYDSGNIVTLNNWQHLVMVRSGNSPGAFHLYLNGSPVTFTYNGVSWHDFPTTMQSTATELDIGRRIYTGFEGYFPGNIDEVRISGAARSADWVSTEYNNQLSPSSFYSYSSLGASTRQNADGTAAPIIKARGGVKFH